MNSEPAAREAVSLAAARIRADLKAYRGEQVYDLTAQFQTGAQLAGAYLDAQRLVELVWSACADEGVIIAQEGAARRHASWDAREALACDWQPRDAEHDRAWAAAFAGAEARLLAGPVSLAVVAGEVALTAATLDPMHVADAVVTAAHLAGLALGEGAFATAEAAVIAARRDREAVRPPLPSPAPQNPAPPHALAEVFELHAEPGLLGDIARWCSAYAFRPVREFAQPAALGVLAGLFGRRFATPTGLGLNLYLVGIAETGGGKDALVSAPRTLLAAAGRRDRIGPGDFTSDAAIEVALRTRPAQLMCIDEFGKLAQAITGRNAPAFAKLAAKTLLELYPRSAPHSEWTGKQRAGDGRDSAGEPIFSPTLSIVGVSTPAGFFEGMTETTLEDGMLNRLTLVIGGAPGARQKDPSRLVPPAGLLGAIKAACEASNSGNLADSISRDPSAPQAIRCVPWADAAAEAAIEAVEAWEDDARDAGRSGICGRAAEQTQKVATLRALARSPAAPAVTAEDVGWAWSFVRASMRALENGARTFMAGSDHEALVKAMERAIQKGGSAGVTNSELNRAAGVSRATPLQRKAALDDLVQSDRAHKTIAQPPGGGRPSERIRPGPAH